MSTNQTVRIVRLPFAGEHGELIFEPAFRELFGLAIKKTDECWWWTGSIDGEYGTYAGMAAHRYAYTCAFGAIPSGSQIHHTCRNKLCVRPFHLQALTPEQHAKSHGARYIHWTNTWVWPSKDRTVSITPVFKHLMHPSSYSSIPRRERRKGQRSGLIRCCNTDGVERVLIHISVPHKLFSKIRKLAARQNRTINNMACVLIEEAAIRMESEIKHRYKLEARLESSLRHHFNHRLSR